MAQYTDAFSSGWATLIVNISESGTSAETNKGTITWSMYIRKDKTCSSYNLGGASISLKIGGTSRYSGDEFDIRSLSVGSSKKIASGTFTATHDDEGELSLSVVASFASGVGLGSASISKTFSGTTIARASSIGSMTESVVAGNSVDIAISRKSSSFTHTVKIAIGDYSVTLEDIGTSASYTIPLEWVSAITTAASGKATVTVTTYSGSTKIGSAVSGTFIINVPDTAEFYPTINDVTIAEAVAKVTTAFGERFVQDMSMLNVTIDAEGVYGSTIKGYSTVLDGVTYIQQAFTSNYIGNAGELTAEVTVTDSRGRTATKSVPITVVAYKKPVITKMEYTHCDQEGNQDSGGTYTKITITGKVYSVDEQNTKALKLLYKSATDEAYTERVVDISALDWEFTAEDIVSGTDPTVTYEYVAELTDKLSGDSARVMTGVVVISRKAGGTGVAFFREATEDGFWIDDIRYDMDAETYDIIMALFGGDDDNILANYITFDNTNRGSSRANGATYPDEWAISTYCTKEDDDGITVLHMVTSGETSYSYLCTAYSPVTPIDEMEGTLRVSVWVKVADVDAWDSKYLFQLRLQDSACTNIAYIEPHITNALSNKPTVENGKWFEFVYERSWEEFKQYATFTGSYTIDDAAFFCIRLSVPKNGDVSFKLPTVKLI